jgi:hypothetical protein
MANQIARTHRTDKGEPGGSATRPHRRRYAITDEAMLQEAGAKLSAFHRNSYVKVASKSEDSGCGEILGRFRG